MDKTLNRRRRQWLGPNSILKSKATVAVKVWNKTHNLDVISQCCSAYINVHYFSYYCGFVRGLHFSFFSGERKSLNSVQLTFPHWSDQCTGGACYWLLECELWNALRPPPSPRERLHVLGTIPSNSRLECLSTGVPLRQTTRHNKQKCHTVQNYEKQLLRQGRNLFHSSYAS